ncbi:uncharacterized protein FOMMEDRAFT_159927 [Fomitiporia mediterranea MF3/22]|uniref:uncharacterized protein n=1 Tax=Fomitiporia mediterranea (strain MF3/22) TaxID=694068 RepID=UPI00044082B7|nr:uncharacterized protein FOMMEDRAFT_159927 [Fomitiporia mediterranea MF3/22]EJD00243.1 hypothetical protein FOMMEDRAFT_159927 [Fomitiporia mediterranea MF3/22]
MQIEIQSVERAGSDCRRNRVCVSLGSSGTKGDGKVEGVDGLNLDRCERWLLLPLFEMVSWTTQYFKCAALVGFWHSTAEYMLKLKDQQINSVCPVVYHAEDQYTPPLSGCSTVVPLSLQATCSRLRKLE